MQPFTAHRGIAAPLWRRDIDTDQIVPKQFLKTIERTGFGAHLFHDWRFHPDGSPRSDFVLNQDQFQRASILIAGPNFGCGSSREHAAWALLDYGFRAVIAPSFADIFRANAITNGLLPAVVAEDAARALADNARAHPDYTLEIDLESRRIRDDKGLDEPFTVDDTARLRLLNGLDDIALILRYEDAITAYEISQI